jgi:hypothetical protein
MAWGALWTSRGQSLSGDLEFPELEGKRSLRTRLMNAYIARLHRAGATDQSRQSHFSA